MISITLDSGTDFTAVCAELRVKIMGIQSLLLWEKSGYLSLMHLGLWKGAAGNTGSELSCSRLNYLGCVFHFYSQH